MPERLEYDRYCSLHICPDNVLDGCLLHLSFVIDKKISYARLGLLLTPLCSNAARRMSAKGLEFDIPEGLQPCIVLSAVGHNKVWPVLRGFVDFCRDDEFEIPH